MKTRWLLAIACVVGFAIDDAEAQKKSYYWYDGNVRRALWIEDDTIAEFTPDSQGENTVRQKHPQANAEPASEARRGVRLWRLERGVDINAAARSLQQQSRAGKFSPVFRDGPRSTHRRALPGRVILTLDPAWSRQQCQTWLQGEGLRVRAQLTHLPNTYVVEVGAGVEALDLANRLYESGRVRGSSPDFWQELHPR